LRRNIYLTTPSIKYYVSIDNIGDMLNTNTYYKSSGDVSRAQLPSFSFVLLKFNAFKSIANYKFHY